MFDSLSILANNLLAEFGNNTAITVTHNYGGKCIEVKSARTNNVIAEVEVDAQFDGKYWPKLSLICDGQEHMGTDSLAYQIMAMRKFPKNRKMNKAWSPIRLTAKAQADAEITKATALYWG